MTTKEKQWRGNATYCAQKLKQENYKDIERHFADLVASAVQDVEQATHAEVRGKMLVILSKLREMDGDDRPKAIDQFIENIQALSTLEHHKDE